MTAEEIDHIRETADRIVHFSVGWKVVHAYTMLSRYVGAVRRTDFHKPAEWSVTDVYPGEAGWTPTWAGTWDDAQLGLIRDLRAAGYIIDVSSLDHRLASLVSQ